MAPNMDKLTDAQFNVSGKSHHQRPNLDPVYRQQIASERFRRRRAEKAEMLRTQVSRINNTFNHTTSKETAPDQETAATRPTNLQSYQEQLLAPVSNDVTSQMYPPTYPRPIELAPEQIEQQTEATREYKQSLMPGHHPDSKESSEAYSKALQDYQTSLMVLDCGKHNTKRLQMRRTDYPDKTNNPDCEYHDSETEKDVRVLQDSHFDSSLQNGHLDAVHLGQSSTSDAQPHPSRKDGIEEVGTYGFKYNGIWYGDTGTADPVTGLDVLADFDFDAFLAQDSDAEIALLKAWLLDQGPKAGDTFNESTEDAEHVEDAVDTYQENERSSGEEDWKLDHGQFQQGVAAGQSFPAETGCPVSMCEGNHKRSENNIANNAHGYNFNRGNETSNQDNEHTIKKELLKYVQEDDQHRFRCQVEDCTKLFSAQHFWEKHVKKRHLEWLEDKQKEIDLMNTMLDPKEPGSMGLDTLPIDRPLFINPKQFDRILKRRQTKHHIESLEQQKKAKSHRPTPPECAGMPAPSQATGSIDVAVQSTALFSLPSRPKHTDEEPDIKNNEIKPNSGDPAASTAQFSRMWLQAYDSLGPSFTSPSPASSTINNAFEAELLGLIFSNPEDELMSQRISERLARIRAVSYNEDPRMARVSKSRQDILNALSVVEGSIGFEAASLGWKCVVSLLSLHEQTLTSIYQQPRVFLANAVHFSLLRLQEVVEILARYAALQKEHERDSLPLKLEHRMTLISLFSTIMEWFALAMLEANGRIALHTGTCPLKMERVDRNRAIFKMLQTIKQKDEACQAFQVVSQTNEQDNCEESIKGTKAEEASDEDWEMVEKDDVDNMAGPLSDWEAIPYTVLDLQSSSLPL